jgi:hypothetical protein
MEHGSAMKHSLNLNEIPSGYLSFIISSSTVRCHRILLRCPRNQRGTEGTCCGKCGFLNVMEHMLMHFLTQDRLVLGPSNFWRRHWRRRCNTSRRIDNRSLHVAISLTSTVSITKPLYDFSRLSEEYKTRVGIDGEEVRKYPSA